MTSCIEKHARVTLLLFHTFPANSTFCFSHRVSWPKSCFYLKNWHRHQNMLHNLGILGGAVTPHHLPSLSQQSYDRCWVVIKIVDSWSVPVPSLLRAGLDRRFIGINLRSYAFLTKLYFADSWVLASCGCVGLVGTPYIYIAYLFEI